jgi:hypothetical protein
MIPTLRDRILAKLDQLDDEQGYQVLDFVEFLESRYAKHVAAQDNVFVRLSSAVEDTLRASKVNASTVAQAMGFMNQAMGVLSGVAAAGKSVVDDVAAVGRQVASDLSSSGARQGAAPGAATGRPPIASSPPAAGDPPSAS